MAIKIKEGLAERCSLKIKRRSGLGPFTVAAPQRRVLNSSRALITGFDWAVATYDAASRELYTIFNSGLTGLTAPGIYYVQLRADIDGIKRGGEIEVEVIDWGP